MSLSCFLVFNLVLLLDDPPDVAGELTNMNMTKWQYIGIKKGAKILKISVQIRFI